MKICSQKDIKVITGIMAASLLLGGCTANTKTGVRNDPKVKTEINLAKVSDTEYDKKTMDELYRNYCFDLFSSTVNGYGSEDNVMISPASVMMALDMVAAGAKEDSLKQLGATRRSLEIRSISNMSTIYRRPLTQNTKRSISTTRQQMR